MRRKAAVKGLYLAFEMKTLHSAAETIEIARLRLGPQKGKSLWPLIGGVVLRQAWRTAIMGVAIFLAAAIVAVLLLTLPA